VFCIFHDLQASCASIDFCRTQLLRTVGSSSLNDILSEREREKEGGERERERKRERRTCVCNKRTVRYRATWCETALRFIEAKNDARKRVLFWR